APRGENALPTLLVTFVREHVCPFLKCAKAETVLRASRRAVAEETDALTDARENSILQPCFIRRAQGDQPEANLFNACPRRHEFFRRERPRNPGAVGDK